MLPIAQMDRFGDLRPLQRRPKPRDTLGHFIFIPSDLSLHSFPIPPLLPCVQVSQRSLLGETLIAPGLGSEGTAGDRLFLKPRLGLIVCFFLIGHSSAEVLVSGHKPACKRAFDFLGV